jgi:glycosyltransferase involved in cell wall biosynthesis
VSPTLSVIIPTFNRPTETVSAIQSVCCEEAGLAEIIVVDDGGSIPFVFGRRVNDAGIEVRLLRRESNGGAGAARESGVACARADLIAFLDSDDRFVPGWPDRLITVAAENAATKRSLLVFGRVDGGSGVQALVRDCLERCPDSLRTTATRVVCAFFNPFYTPSLAVSKGICEFMPGLRHCEDYYTAAAAAFKADVVVAAGVTACQLGRAPNTSGGSSSARKSMFRGELVVRRSMLAARYVPLRYKLLLPLGYAYQFVRGAAKLLLAR